MKHLNRYITEALIKNHIRHDKDCVDLGLPSGTLWCSHNVGATRPEDIGQYFSWGETLTKKQFTWETYKFAVKNGDDTEFTKYHNHEVDVLDLQDDAAYNDNPKYRMPTQNEVIELFGNCTIEQTNMNGVEGYKVISNKNGNYIFFPSGGYMKNISELNNAEYAYLWTANLPQISNHLKQVISYEAIKYSLNNASSNNRDFTVDMTPKCRGLNVRGVLR